MNHKPPQITEWRIYPPALTRFKHGDEVFIRTKSNKEVGRRGRVILDKGVVDADLPPVTNNSNASKGKRNKLKEERVNVEVRYPCGGSNSNTERNYANENSNTKDDDKEDHIDHSCSNIESIMKEQNKKSSTQNSSFYQASFRASRLIPCYVKPIKSKETPNEKKSTIIITAKTHHYRQLAASQLCKDDNVLEIGCSNGECSLVIAKYGNKLVGFDTSSEMITQAKEKINRCSFGSIEKNKMCTFHVIDPFIDPKKAAQLVQGANVIFIDIGGNRDISSVLRMIEWSRNLFDPNLIVVKSEEMVANIENATQLRNRNTNESGNDEFMGEISNKKAKKFPFVSIDTSGVIDNCENWYADALEKEYSVEDKKSSVSFNVGPPKYSHPLKAPLALDGSTTICRYFNYCTIVWM